MHHTLHQAVISQHFVLMNQYDIFSMHYFYIIIISTLNNNTKNIYINMTIIRQEKNGEEALPDLHLYLETLRLLILNYFFFLVQQHLFSVSSDFPGRYSALSCFNKRAWKSRCSDDFIHNHKKVVFYDLEGDFNANTPCFLTRGHCSQSQNTPRPHPHKKINIQNLKVTEKLVHNLSSQSSKACTLHIL